MDAVQWHVEPLAEVGAELLVAVALLATQVEVAVGGVHPCADGSEDEQQRHAVGSARERHDVELLGGVAPFAVRLVARFFSWFIHQVVAQDVMAYDAFGLVHGFSFPFFLREFFNLYG